ncbi:MAG: DUF2232 domain-containing protein [Clostridia bacterium]|nr:DUF2232 domain-containing protein [Clostridia bacterium]
MDSRQVSVAEANRGPLAGSILLAVIVGALLPVIALTQISLLVPVLMLGGIMAAYLGARSGWIPVGVLAVASGVSTGFLMGGTITLVLLVASIAPSAVVVLGARSKRPFFEQMNAGVIAFIGALVAATLVAYTAYGGRMIARFVDVLRAEYNRMPDATLQPMVEWMNAMLPVAGTAREQAMTVASFRAQLSGVLDLMQQTYAQMIPGALLSGAILSGVLSVFWANWTMARRGMATNESFVGMSGWTLPPQLTLGAVGLWAVGLLLMGTGRANGTTIYMTISQAVGAAFAVQALCALNRRMLRADRPLRRRRLLIGLLAVAGLLLRGVGAALAYVGVASALFGSHGAIRRWMQNRPMDPPDDDNSDQ